MMNVVLFEEHERAKMALTKNAVLELKKYGSFSRIVDAVIGQGPCNACALIDLMDPDDAVLLFNTIKTFANNGKELAQRIVDRAEELELSVTKVRPRLRPPAVP